MVCNNADFTILCTALRQTGLDSALDDKNSIWTLFTPTDEAFERLDQNIAQSVFNNLENVQFVLLYHAIGGREVFSKQLECTERIMMANEKETRTVCSGDQVFQKGGGNVHGRLPEIVEVDVKACNGVIHVVNRIILPTRIPGTESHYHKSPTHRPVYHKPSPPSPYKKPTHSPYKKPTYAPYKKPTRKPTPAPYRKPTKKPSPYPTPHPTPYPTARPTKKPTIRPTKKPTPYPVAVPAPKPYYPEHHYPQPQPYYPEPKPYYPDDDGAGYHDDDGYNHFINHQEPYHQEPHYPNNGHHPQPEHPPQHHDDKEGRGGDFPCVSIGT